MNWLVGAVPGLVAAAAAVLLLVGYWLIRTDPAEQLNLEEIGLLGQAARDRAGRRGPLMRLSYEFVPLLRRLLQPRWIAWLQRQVDIAGRPDGLDVDGVLARIMLWLIILSPALVIFVLRGNLLAILMSAAAALIMPLARLSAQARSRRERIDRDLPDFLDVLAVTVSAGLGFRAALDTVARRFGGPLSEVVMTALNQIANGASVRSAFRTMRERTASEPMSEFVTAYLQAEELGAPLMDTLNQIAADMRRSAAQRQRQRAAKIAPRVTLVVTLALVPGAMLLLVVGLYIGSGSSFGAIFGG